MMTDSLNGKRFIFVGGSPRSGTTLVQNMLDSHPDICGGPEFLHLPDIISVRRKLHYSINQEWIDEFCYNDDVDRVTTNFIENLLLPLADRHNCKFLSEKTPANVLIFTDLMALFPEARFIHVVRDPRAIISSMLQVGLRGKKKGWNTKDFTTKVSAAIDYVRQTFKAGFDAAERASDRTLIVAYERLIFNSEKETKRICNFLAIEWSKNMLRPSQFKHPGEKAITNDVWYSTKTYNKDPDPRRVDKWKTQLTTVQKIMITNAFKDVDELNRLGYDFSNEGFSQVERNLAKIAFFLYKISKKLRLKSWVRRLSNKPSHLLQKITTVTE